MHRLLHVILLMLLLPGAAAAQGRADKRRALKMYREAQALYRKGDYREAIRKYEGSHAAMPKRQTLYYWAESHRRLGQFRLSHGVYSRYMKMLPPGEQAAFANKLEALRWQRRCALSVATSPGGATVTLEGRERGKTPHGGALKLIVPGGRHRLSVTLAGHQPAGGQVVAEFGEPQAVSLVLVPVTLKPAPTPPASRPGPAPRPVTPAPAPTPPASQPAPPRPTVTPDGAFVLVFGGPYWADYGAGDDMTTAPVVGFRLGYLWRWTRVGLHVDVSATVQPRAGDAGDGGSTLVSFMGGGGLRVYLRDALWIGPRLSVGVTTLHGLGSPSPLVTPGMLTEGSYSGLLLRPAVVVGWTVWRGLTLTLIPVALDYTPRHSAFDQTVEYLMRLQVALGVGWQW